MVLIPVSCTMYEPPSKFIRYYIRSTPLNIFLTFPVKSLRIWFMSYVNGLVVFPTFFNFSLNLAIRSSRSEAQSAPDLVFADSNFGCKEYNQSDFSVNHLVMSICRVFSCAVGRGCLLWPVRSLGKTLISLCPASFCTPRPNFPVTPGVSWLPIFACQSPIMKGTSFLGDSSRRSCRSC